MIQGVLLTICYLESPADFHYYSPTIECVRAIDYGRVQFMSTLATESNLRETIQWDYFKERESLKEHGFEWVFVIPIKSLRKL
jgi:hypothetical protein